MTKSPDRSHKRIDTPLTRKLAKLFTWKDYFDVNRKEIAIPLNALMVPWLHSYAVMLNAETNRAA